MGTTREVRNHGVYRSTTCGTSVSNINRDPGCASSDSYIAADPIVVEPIESELANQVEYDMDEQGERCNYEKVCLQR